MEKDSLKTIKNTEKEFEEKIEEKKQILEEEKKQRINFWLEKEKEVTDKYQLKIENLDSELKNNFSDIEKKVSSVYQAKKQEVEKNTQKNLGKFTAEVFKRI